MAKKRNSSRNRQKASQQQTGRKSQTTMGAVLAVIIGLVFWWFTGSSPDAFLNNDAGNIGTTPTVQEFAQVSDEVNASVENASEPNIETSSTEDNTDEAAEEIADSKAESADSSTDEATEDSVADTKASNEKTEVVDPEPAPIDTPVPVATATDTPVPDPTATATTPPKPTYTAIPRPRGPPGMSEIHIDDLPPEARDTIDLIFSGGPYPFDRDGITFQNREGILPARNRGYYEEYTVITPGLSHRGAKRIVIGREDDMYYTDDHYESFSWIAED